MRYNIEREINVAENILINCEGIFLGIFFQYLLSFGDNISMYCKFKDNAISIMKVQDIFLITSHF